MPSAKEIKTRIASIQDTQKITNAMYLISSTKLKKSKKLLEETEPYFYSLQDLIRRIPVSYTHLWNDKTFVYPFFIYK